MEKRKNRRKQYTKEEFMEIIHKNKHKYKTINDLNNDWSYAWIIIKRLNIKEEVLKIIPRMYYKITYDECKEITSKYKTTKEFRIDYPRHYMVIWNNKWFDLTQHLRTSSLTLKKRCVYEYKFTDGAIYVGLTSNFESRHYEHFYGYDRKTKSHKKNSSVLTHMKNTGLTPTWNIVMDYTDELTALNYEKELIERYRSEGLKILNITKGGTLGGGTDKYTNKEEIRIIAQKYIGRKQFCKSNGTAYRTAIKNGWLDEVCSHMKTSKELRTIWTEDVVKKLIEDNNIVKRYHLKMLNQSAYTSAIRLGFLTKLLPEKSNRWK